MNCDSDCDCELRFQFFFLRSEYHSFVDYLFLVSSISLFWLYFATDRTYGSIRVWSFFFMVHVVFFFWFCRFFHEMYFSISVQMVHGTFVNRQPFGMKTRLPNLRVSLIHMYTTYTQRLMYVWMHRIAEGKWKWKWIYGALSRAI